MGLDQNPRLAHFVFVHLQDLPQRVHLPAHMLQHLMHGVDLDISLLEALHGKTDGHVLSRLHQQGRIVLFRGILRSQSFQQLLQVKLGIRIGLGQFFLHQLRLGPGVGTDFSEFSEQPDGLNNLFFLKRHHPARPGSLANGGNSIAAARCSRRYIRDTANRYAAPSTAAARAFGRGNELQQFLRIVQPLLEFGAQRLGSNLRRDGYVSVAWISRYKFDLVDPNRRLFVIPERILDLLDHVLSFGTAHGKGPNQPGKIVNRDSLGKMNACQTGCRQKLGEAAFRLPRFQRYAVQQQPVLGHTQQKAAIAILG